MNKKRSNAYFDYIYFIFYKVVRWSSYHKLRHQFMFMRGCNCVYIYIYINIPISSSVVINDTTLVKLYWRIVQIHIYLIPLQVNSFCCCFQTYFIHGFFSYHLNTLFVICIRHKMCINSVFLHKTLSLSLLPTVKIEGRNSFVSCKPSWCYTWPPPTPTWFWMAFV